MVQLLAKPQDVVGAFALALFDGIIFYLAVSGLLTWLTGQATPTPSLGILDTTLMKIVELGGAALGYLGAIIAFCSHLLYMINLPPPPPPVENPSLHFEDPRGDMLVLYAAGLAAFLTLSVLDGARILGSMA